MKKEEQQSFPPARAQNIREWWRGFWDGMETGGVAPGYAELRVVCERLETLPPSTETDLLIKLKAMIQKMDET